MINRRIKLIVQIILALAIAVLGIFMFIKPITNLPSFSFSSFVYENSEKYTQASEGSAFGISNLDINWVSGFVDVVPYDGSYVKFEEQSNQSISDDERLCYWQDGNTLKIQFASVGVHKAINNQKQLTVYVPSDIELNEIKIESVSADVMISGMKAKTADLETVSGNYNLNSFNSYTLEFETVSGNLLADNVGFVSFDSESTSGTVEISLSDFYKTERLKIESVSGDINLSLPQTLEFNLDFDTVSGELSCLTQISVISKNQLKRGNGSVKINLETVSGDVSVK